MPSTSHPTPTSLPPPPPPPRHHVADLPRVLSIQSHVVSGRVGNRAAVFPLQLHRFDVDEINTVSFSNHTGYRAVAGTRLSREGLGDLLSGLERNGLLVVKGGKSRRESRSRPGYSYVLTGYVGRAETLSGIREAIRGMIEEGSDDDDDDTSDDGDGDDNDEAEEEAARGEENRKKQQRSRRKNRRPLVVVDPVMGDHDRGRASTSATANGDDGGGEDENGELSTFLSSLYVPEDVPSVYRRLLPLADVITPNAFEAEVLLMEGEGGEEGGEGEGEGDGNDRKEPREVKKRRPRIVDEASAVAACSALHSRGPSIVVLTSVAFPRSPCSSSAAADADSASKEDTLTIYASQCARGSNSSSSSSPPYSSPSFPRPPEGATAQNPAVWKLELPRIDAPFTGTGDLLTSLLLAFLHKAAAADDDDDDDDVDDKEKEEAERDDKPPRDLGWVLERAAAGVRAVVEATVAGAAAEAARAEAEAERRRRRRRKNKKDGGGKEEEEEGEEKEKEEEKQMPKPPVSPSLSSDYWSSPRAVAARELRLVQCADALVSPRVVARAERIR